MERDSGAIHGPVGRYLLDDHGRLEALLARASANPRDIDRAAYSEFRRGILRHIRMEEKVLLPDARRRRGGESLPVAAQLRAEHGAIAALLVPSPRPGLLATLRAVLDRHNLLEESAGGVYEACERLAGAEGSELLERLRSVPDVSVSDHVDSHAVRSAARRALVRAGFPQEADDVFFVPD